MYLDLEYRAKHFSEVLGNDPIKQLLLHRSRIGTLTSHSLLFSGPKGCGKTSLARIVSRAILCQSKSDGEPCNRCDTCKSVLAERHMSVQELDAASNGSIDRIRSFVDDSEYNSLDGTSNIIILDEAHRISPGAQDVLLKSIEDRKLFIIACTTEASKIRPALRDRLDEFSVKPPPVDQLLKRCTEICIEKSVRHDTSVLRQLIEYHQSHPRATLNSLALLMDLGVVDQSGLDYVTNSSVRKLVKEVLSAISFEAGNKYSLFDKLRISESASVAREYIVSAINQSIRKYRSVRCDVDAGGFVDSKNYGRFYFIGRDLCRSTTITWSDIEFILFNESNSTYVQTPTPEKRLTAEASPTPANVVNLSHNEPTKDDHIRSLPDIISSQTIVKTSVKPKSIDIEGVKFNSDERITTLHDKITPSRGPTVVSDESTPVVQYERHKMPMSEQEFARAFLDRFK